ncbi:MAG TPA: site-specific integrase [Solirubrobacteraceae bacterium]|jgi:integrase|nr:site-specific integrase [Solirubrobacteraceae bacterium]
MKSTPNARRVRVERGIYVQPNGKYAICAWHTGKLHFRTVQGDLAGARQLRGALIASLRYGSGPPPHPLQLGMVADLWLDRFEAKVTAGERHLRTLEAHRYQLEYNLLPILGQREVAGVTVDDVVALLSELQQQGLSAKTAAAALATLHGVLHYARRHGWAIVDPIAQLERDERPRPARRRYRVLGRDEIERLLDAAHPPYRLMIATALYTGLRISELLGLIWSDIDPSADTITVRAQLSRAHRHAPARRVAPKTSAAYREIPLIEQLGHLLLAHKRTTPFAAPTDWVFGTSRGTPQSQRNVGRRGLQRAVERAQLDREGWPSLRFHDLRHTFASHLILDHGLDVAQVSRILGHASTTITLDVYTHLFETARHGRELRARLAASPFAELLNPRAVPPHQVVVLATDRRHLRDAG